MESMEKTIIRNHLPRRNSIHLSLKIGRFLQALIDQLCDIIDVYLVLERFGCEF